jgi:uncharacterized cupredoxin-like copper-binding protein
MSAVQEPPSRPYPPEAGAETSTTAALADLRNDVRKQGRSIRSTQQAFTIFAVMALLIAMASLLAVAFKLERAPRTVTVSSPAPAAAPAPPLSPNVDVTLAQFAVTPGAPAAPPGRVTFRVHNAGTIKHEFVVIRTPKPAADLPIVNGRASESGNIGETGDLAPGRSKSVSLDLRAGHYVLICNLPGHYLAGQHTDFTVR